MKHVIYILFAMLFMVTACSTEEPGYGYKDPTVYFSRAGVVTIETPASEIPISVYCSGNPKRGEVQVTVSADRGLYNSFKQKDKYTLLPEGIYTPASAEVTIPSQEQNAVFNLSIQTSGLPKGSYVLPLKLVSTSAFEILKDKDILYLTFVVE